MACRFSAAQVARRFATRIASRRAAEVAGRSASSAPRSSPARTRVANRQRQQVERSLGDRDLARQQPLAPPDCAAWVRAADACSNRAASAVCGAVDVGAVLLGDLRRLCALGMASLLDAGGSACSCLVSAPCAAAI
jgi:hypothetical protein